MVGPNKILTVSYGTFSCTLEGFDDPFSTMRGIAEYFRDLAADDRYFGAEPPTPDAEMLQRIAETEIQRRVETRMEQGGFVLRQAEEPQEEAPQLPHDAVSEPVARDASADTEMDDEASDEGGAPRPFVQAKTGSGQPSDLAGTETVAEKLARIRAVVNQKTDDYEEAEVAPVAFDQTDEYGVADDTEGDASVEEGIIATQSDDQEDDEQSDQAQHPEAEQDQTEFDGEAVASEDLQEVDEVPSDDEADDQYEHAAASEEHIDAAPDQTEDDAEGIEAAEDASDVDLVDQVATSEIADDEDPDSQAEEGFTAADHASVLAVLDADEPIGDEELFGEQNATEDDSFAALIEQENRAADIEETEASTDVAEEESEGVSRLLKMRLNDFQAATQAHTDQIASASEAIETEGADEAVEEDLSRDTAAEISTLSEEDEADLMASLAEVANGGEHDEDDGEGVEFEAELEAKDEAAEELSADEGAADFEAEDEHQEPTDEALAEPVALSEEVADDDEPESELDATTQPDRPVSRPEGLKVARLLEQTNSELAESESSRRRSAIAHLKAAVAATRAERAATDSADMEQSDTGDISAYREDLAQVVRPRRPGEGVRSVPRRLPPLVLVSEQRVDLDAVHEENQLLLAEENMINPRRVRSEGTLVDQEDGENIFSEAGSFSEFAREMGATELPDLLEAAAAYYHYVEGQPHFSRPQIMNAVAAMNDAGEFSREEGLRSFGILLRRGTIRKIRRGQFEISDDTRFRPELRAGE